MHQWLAIGILIAFATPARAAQPVAFEGSVWTDGGVSLAFDTRVAPGEMKTMSLARGQVIEMSVDAAGQPRVRLVGRGGEELHAATRTDAPARFTFQYAMCRKGAVAYSNPPEPGKSGCT